MCDVYVYIGTHMHMSGLCQKAHTSQVRALIPNPCAFHNQDGFVPTQTAPSDSAVRQWDNQKPEFSKPIYRGV